MMNEIEEKLSLALSEIINKRGISIVNIVISNMSRNPDIQIIIDSATGISLDDCSYVSKICLLYTSPSPRDQRGSRMPSSA